MLSISMDDGAASKRLKKRNGMKSLASRRKMKKKI